MVHEVLFGNGDYDERESIVDYLCDIRLSEVEVKRRFKLINEPLRSWVMTHNQGPAHENHPAMPFFIDEAFGCLCMGRNAAQYDVLEEQPAPKFTGEKKREPKTTNSLAAEVLSILYAADTNDERLVQRVQDIVHETGWYDGLAAAVLDGLENALKAQAPMGQAMNDACGKARQVTADVLGFAREQPVFCALVALGILVLLAPWGIEVLGFGELGPIEGSFAAFWQSRYALGSVPKGSWFSFFQRLGMVWRRKPTALPAIAI